MVNTISNVGLTAGIIRTACELQADALDFLSKSLSIHPAYKSWNELGCHLTLEAVLTRSWSSKSLLLPMPKWRHELLGAWMATHRASQKGSSKMHLKDPCPIGPYCSFSKGSSSIT